MFAIWQFKNDTEPKTMYRIARALGMIPSQKFTTMLLELCDEGKLTFIEREKSGRWTARAYSATPSLEHYHEKYSKRRVSVKRRGEVVGSLEVPSGQLGLWS